MTKSTITRERLEELAAGQSGFNLRISTLEESQQLARMALAAMDSEPVAVIDQANLDYLRSGADADVWPPEREEMGDVLLYRNAQPAPAFPDFDDVLESLDYEVRCNAWESEHVMQACQTTYDACRAAMLQELQKSAGAEATCRSNENVQVLHTKSPAQSDCCPAQNHVSPEQNGDTPAQSQGWIPVSERMPPSRHEVLVGRWWGEKPRWCCKWATYIPGHPDAQSSGWLIPGASWTPTHWMPLPAAPQEVKSES